MNCIELHQNFIEEDGMRLRFRMVEDEELTDMKTTKVSKNEENLSPGMGTLTPPEGWVARDPSDVRFSKLKATKEPFKAVRRE